MILEDIIKGINRIIKSEFPSMEIYANEIQQGFKEPCFFIKMLKLDEKQIIGERYFRRYFFDIRYHPDKHKKSQNIWGIADKLQDLLEMITTPEQHLLRGTDRNAEVEDDVLHYFVSYNMFVIKPKNQEEYMENLSMEQNTKGSD